MIELNNPSDIRTRLRIYLLNSYYPHIPLHMYRYSDLLALEQVEESKKEMWIIFYLFIFIEERYICIVDSLKIDTINELACRDIAPSPLQARSMDKLLGVLEEEVPSLLVISSNLSHLTQHILNNTFFNIDIKEGLNISKSSIDILYEEFLYLDFTILSLTERNALIEIYESNHQIYD